MTSEYIKLEHEADVYNFYIGQPVRGKLNDAGQFVPFTRWDWIKARCATIWNHYTRWWRPRQIVTSIDRKYGGIRVATQYWSWRRMKWIP